jgi:hypothetical protein
MNDVTMKLRYQTKDKYDAPKGFLQYCTDGYLLAHEKKQVELLAAKQENTKNELELAESLLDVFFEHCDEHHQLTCESDQYYSYLYKFDKPAIWDSVFIQKLLDEYISKEEMKQRKKFGFDTNLLYTHLKEVFYRRYCFKITTIPSNFVKQDQDITELKDKMTNNMMVFNTKIRKNVAIDVLLGAKFREETGLVFVAEKQASITKVSLFKHDKFLWSETV